MLLGPKHTTISIEPGVMYAEHVKLGDEPSSQVVAKYQWQADNCSQVFRQLVAESGGHVASILLSDVFCYVVGYVTEQSKTDFTSIEKTVGGMVPTDLTTTAWSYRLEPFDEQSKKVSAFVLTNEFFAAFQPALEALTDVIGVVEPVSMVLTHELEGAKTSCVIIHRDTIRQLAVVIKQGTVVHVGQLAGAITPESLQPLVAYAQDQLETTTPYFCLFGFEDSSILPTGLQSKSTQQHINPAFSLAERSSEEYAKLLTEAAPTSNPIKPTMPTAPKPSPAASTPAESEQGLSKLLHTQRRSLLALAALVGVFVLVIAFVLVPYLRKSSQRQRPAAEPPTNSLSLKTTQTSAIMLTPRVLA